MNDPPASQKPGGRRRTGIALVAAGLAAFAAIAADVLAGGLIHQWDEPLQAYLHKNSTSNLIMLFSGLSGMGNKYVIITLGLLVGVPLFLRKRRRTLAVWILALAGSGIINSVLKNSFRIPRPPRNTYWVFQEGDGYTFPSGHTMAVAVAAGALALVLLHTFPASRSRRLLAALVVAFVSMLEAFALLYIGVHYLSDVLAALAVATAWLGVIRLLLPPANPAVF